MDYPRDKGMAELPSNPGPLESPQPSAESKEHTSEADSTTSKANSSRQEPRGRFVKIDGSVGGSGYDETTVDVIAVPCPGADSLETWSRDALVENYFGAPSMRSSTRNSDMRESQSTGATGGSRRAHVTSGAPKTGPASWVRQGIRREASMARVLMYEHRDVVEGTTLNVLAEDLLREVLEMSLTQDGSRPIFFISHSIGGLVVKLALGKASRNPLYESILFDCYGAVFFATPHRGSNYLSMSEISSSIQGLLELSHPLPRSITDELRVGHPLLLYLEEEFRVLASDLQVWTFYETIESRLSGEADARPGEVYFTAAITSLKSAIIGIRQETIYPLQSDHANCASFGKNNAQTMKLFLKGFAWSIARADRTRKEKTHTPMNLEDKVPVEVHGFYEDTVAVTSVEALTTIRTWSTRIPLSEYLSNGPVECLDDRLNEANDGPVDNQFMAARRRTSRLKEDNLPSPPPLELGSNVLGIVGAHGGDRRAKSEIALRKSETADADGGNSLYPASTAPPAAPENSPDPDGTAARDGRQAGHDAVRSRSTSGTRAPRGETTKVESARSRRRVALTRRFTDQFNPKWSGPLERPFFQGPPFSPESPFGPGGQQNHGADPYVPVFVKPEAANRRYIWTHIPFTNPAWVKKVFETLEVKEGRNLSDVYNHGQWYSKHTRGRHFQHYAYFVKPACGWVPPAPRSPLTPHSSLVASQEPIIYLFIPFLHFDSYKNLLRRRSLIQRRLRQGRARPVPQSVARLPSLELQVIWEYLGYDPPVNCRRTIDQYAYPSLRDTRPRDDDQMLYKMTKERIALADQVGVDAYDNPAESAPRTRRETSSAGSKTHADDCECSEEETTVNEEEVLNGNVLMVDQLWMWAIGSNTLLTFFSRRESSPTEGPLYQQADLRDSIFNDVNSDVTRQCESALDMAALIALHAVTVLVDRASHPDLEVFRIFEEAISILTEKMTSSLKDFRTQHLRTKPAPPTPETQPRSARNQHAHEADMAAHENRDSTSALLELRDLEDELATLISLFDKQEKMLGTMRNLYHRSAQSPSETGLSYITEALGRLAEYKQRAGEMTRRVRATRDDYDKLLQMVQRQAQVDEVRLQRLQADVASSQSRSVMIFTVFTVIFLPLSFFTSIFGMNTREWEGAGVPRLATICLIALPSSAFLIGLALVTAWSTRMRTFLRLVVSLHRRVMAFWVEVLEAVGSVAKRGEGQGEEGARRRASEWKRRRRLAKEGSAGSADFWERHRLEREHAYRIPVANRKARSGERK